MISGSGVVDAVLPVLGAAAVESEVEEGGVAHEGDGKHWTEDAGTAATAPGSAALHKIIQCCDL